MSTAAIGASTRGGGSVRRLLVPLVLILAVASVVFGTRYAISARMVSNPFAKPAPVVAAGPATIPTSAAIESQWGIRFTNVVLLADGGLVEMRYQVLDAGKSARIHSGSLKDLPVIKVEESGKAVSSQSMMFHFHHGDTNAQGRTYSILYANAAGAIHLNSRVAIQLPDGLQLQHILVQN
jgi:hypothetical protein